MIIQLTTPNLLEQRERTWEHWSVSPSPSANAAVSGIQYKAKKIKQFN